MKKMIYWICLTVLTCGLLLAQGHPVLADDQPVNEDELFSGQDTMVEEETVVNNSVGDELKEKRISVTGEVNANTTFTRKLASRDWTALSTEDEGKLTNLIMVDFYTDIRLRGGIKSFLSVEAAYLPEDNSTPLGIKEFFVDTNWQNKVYFRTGKQLLKWGTCYFWNPTDLINERNKDFLDMDKPREGTYGVKVQIPSGTKRNIYFFLGMDQATEINDLSLAGKYEFLAGNTEMSFSFVGRNGYQPVYGYDVTGRIFDLDVRGEICLSPGGNQEIMDYDSLGPVPEGDGFIPKISLGCTKYFDYGNIKDRISLTGEFYYNGAGYEQNILQRIRDDIDSYNWRVYMSKVYEPYRNSKYYFAFFSSVSKFIKTDLTLNVNGITNLVDHSGTLTCGVSYHPSITDIFIDFNVNGNFGEKNTEATFMGDLYSLYLGTRILF
jgi:hypothetical protein